MVFYLHLLLRCRPDILVKYQSLNRRFSLRPICWPLHNPQSRLIDSIDLPETQAVVFLDDIGLSGNGVSQMALEMVEIHGEHVDVGRGTLLSGQNRGWVLAIILEILD